MRIFATLVLVSSFLIFFASVLWADEIEDIGKQIQQKQQEYQETQKKIEQLKKDQESLNQQIKDLGGKIGTTQANIDSIAIKINETKQKIAELEGILSDKQERLHKQGDFRDNLVRIFYKKSQVSSLELVLSDSKFAEVSQRIAFHTSSLNEAKKVISDLNREIIQFESDKKTVEDSKKGLESNLNSLASARNNLVNQQNSTKNQLATAAKEKSTAESQIVALEDAIKGLSSKQKELIAQKFAASTQNTSVGDNAPVSVEMPAPSFKPAFAFATYGYPHRVGMNQYGAYGRAKVGQNFRQILEAYYSLNGGSLKLVEGYSEPATISVEGYGNISLEDDYLKGIAEMPSSWPIEALKAQVVAARTYALSYTSGGGSICTDQRCQVYIGKNKGGAWEQAVNETRGMVMTYNDSPFSAWYASTSGGYTRSSDDVWNNSKPWANRLKDFGPNGAFDGPSYGNSPWYHKAWGDREGGKLCKTDGYNPWLTTDEVEDIFNSLMLSDLDSGLNQYLSPPDGCNSSARGWTPTQVKEELAKRGKKEIGKINTVFTSQDGSGYTDFIYADSANYGQVRFDGLKFKNMFNLRSIGNMVVWTSFYDVIIK